MGAFGSSFTWTLGCKGPKYFDQIYGVLHNFFRRTLVAAALGKVRSFIIGLTAGKKREKY
jgi:hypothetical protein